MYTDGPGFELWDYQTTFSIWPQLGMAALICSVCFGLNLWLTRRRELPSIQRLPVLG
ncbi:hypothetical protein KIMH_10790 [Bombiscardovia apis]|uniref:Uncharacterized protein n=2 Tax=Bombiscardovia apis TaxID=2932182 RepID=A0ABM8BDY8_9BIFI|nr:hypothetical protein KIMH_10790 [Bombiscardovia apis]